jgi:hypothetical protein
VEKRLLVVSHKPMSKDGLSGHFPYNRDGDCCILIRLYQNLMLRSTLPFHWVGMVQVTAKPLEADARKWRKMTTPQHQETPLSELSCLQKATASHRVRPHDDVLSFVFRGQSSEWAWSSWDPVVTQQFAYDDQVHHDRLGLSMPVKLLAVVEVVGGFKFCSSLQGAYVPKK